MADKGGGLFGCIVSLMILALAGFGGYTLYQRVTGDTVQILELPGANATRTAIVANATRSAPPPSDQHQPSETTEADLPDLGERKSTSSDPCEGAEEWLRDSIARSNEVVTDSQALVQTIEAGGPPSRDDFEIYVEFLRSTLEAHQSSSPPAEGADLQAALLRHYEMNLARAESGLAGAPEPYSELEVVEQADLVTAEMRRFEDTCL
jgi:hypothetical protein